MATTARTAWRRMPWRRTKAFWAPMATMRDSPVPKPAAPAVKVLVMASTLRTGPIRVQLKILTYHQQP
ncbi:hypothetical protein SVIOM74S_03462 [Streptomyces violarus]